MEKIVKECPVILTKLGLCILAVVLAYYTNLNFGKVAAGIICVYCIVSVFFSRIAKWFATAGGVLLVIYSVRYFDMTMIPYLDKSDATQYCQLTQLTIPRRWEFHDMWISPIVKGKTVNLTYAAEWCHEYFKEFAAETVIDEGGLQHISIPFELREYYFGLETMTFAGTRDFFEEEILQELDSQEELPRMHLAVSDLVHAEEIYVMTDDTNHMFISSREVFEKVLEDYEN